VTADTTTAEIPGEGRWHTLVLGIGNVLYADEGFGVRALESLNARYRFPEGVRLMDGGTQGIFLLPWVRSAERLLIFDAIDFGLPAGQLRLIRDADVPCYMGVKKVSMHQAGFQEVLASAAFSGSYPRALALVGVQPDVLDNYGGSLTPTIKARIPDALDAALRVFAEWDIEVVARRVPLESGEFTGPRAVDIARYEWREPPPAREGV
jgi:hydrogenase maturation protease